MFSAGLNSIISALTGQQPPNSSLFGGDLGAGDPGQSDFASAFAEATALTEQGAITPSALPLVSPEPGVAPSASGGEELPLSGEAMPLMAAAAQPLPPGPEGATPEAIDGEAADTGHPSATRGTTDFNKPGPQDVGDSPLTRPGKPESEPGQTNASPGRTAALTETLPTSPGAERSPPVSAPGVSTDAQTASAPDRQAIQPTVTDVGGDKAIQRTVPSQSAPATALKPLAPAMNLAETSQLSPPDNRTPESSTQRVSQPQAQTAAVKDLQTAPARQPEPVPAQSARVTDAPVMPGKALPMQSEVHGEALAARPAPSLSAASGTTTAADLRVSRSAMSGVGPQGVGEVASDAPDALPIARSQAQRSVPMAATRPSAPAAERGNDALTGRLSPESPVASAGRPRPVSPPTPEVPARPAPEFASQVTPVERSDLLRSLRIQVAAPQSTRQDLSDNNTGTTERMSADVPSSRPAAAIVSSATAMERPTVTAAMSSPGAAGNADTAVTDATSLDDFDMTGLDDTATTRPSRVLTAEGQPQPRAIAPTAGTDVGSTTAQTAITGLSSAAVRAPGVMSPMAEALGEAMQVAPESPEFPEEVMGQVRLARMNGQREIRLNLHPAELGRLTITVANEGEGTKVAFVVDNPQARDVIEHSMPRLREMLADAGLQLDDSSVFEQHAGAGDSSGQEAGQVASRAARTAEGDIAAEGQDVPAATNEAEGLLDAYA